MVLSRFSGWKCNELRKILTEIQNYNFLSAIFDSKMKEIQVEKSDLFMSNPKQFSYLW